MWYLFAGALGTLLVSAFWPSIGVLFAELLTTPFTPNPDEVARRRGRVGRLPRDEPINELAH